MLKGLCPTIGAKFLYSGLNGKNRHISESLFTFFLPFFLTLSLPLFLIASSKSFCGTQTGKWFWTRNPCWLATDCLKISASAHSLRCQKPKVTLKHESIPKYMTEHSLEWCNVGADTGSCHLLILPSIAGCTIYWINTAYAAIHQCFQRSEFIWRSNML